MGSSSLRRNERALGKMKQAPKKEKVLFLLMTSHQTTNEVTPGC